MRPSRNNESYSPDSRHPKEDPMVRLRSTLVRLEDRTSDLYQLRNSYSSTSLRTISPSEGMDFRMSHLNPPKKKSLQGLKSTLDLLEDKIKNAKEELQLPISSMKKKTRNVTLEE